jgi:hypothetical protein
LGATTFHGGGEVCSGGGWWLQQMPGVLEQPAPSDVILIHGEIRGGEYHAGRIGELAMEIHVCVLLSNFLGVLGFHSNNM